MTLAKTMMITAIAALWIVSAATAHAEEERLKISDYDLSNEADIHLLQTKIVKIARRMCVGLHKEWSYFYSDDVKNCIQETTDNAIASTEHTGVQRLHNDLTDTARYDPDRKFYPTVNVATK